MPLLHKGRGDKQAVLSAWKTGLYLLGCDCGQFFSSQCELRKWKELNPGSPPGQAGPSPSMQRPAVTFSGHLHFLRPERDMGWGPSLTPDHGGGSWKGCERLWRQRSLPSCAGHWRGLSVITVSLLSLLKWKGMEGTLSRFSVNFPQHLLPGHV